MKKEIVIGVILAVLLIGGIISYISFGNRVSYSGESNTNPDSESNVLSSGNENNVAAGTSNFNININIKGFAFSLSTLTIKQGESVTWTNMDSVLHTVTSDSGTELDSELLSKGNSYTHTFNEKGTFDYHCTPHPSMTGNVVVE